MSPWIAALALQGALAQDTELPGRDRPGAVMPDRHWDIVHLDLDLQVDPLARTVVGTATHTVTPLGTRHGILRLHQVALDIGTVTVDGEPVEGWRVGRDTLDIPMPAEGAEHEVAIAYTASPQTGLHFRAPGNTAHPVVEVWSQGEDIDNRHWFPGWDHPSDKFTLTTHITTLDELTAIANGVLEDKAEAEPGWTRWTYTLDRPIVNYLVALTIGNYTVVGEQGAVPLEYVSASVHDPATIRRGFDQARPQMDYLAELLDEPFPYPIYRQVMVSGFLYGGMENASLTINSDGRLQPDPEGRTLGTEELAAHELAHQWFGDLVTCYGWRELWLNEGFATFYTGRWMEHHRGEAYYATKVRGWMRSAARLKTPMSPRGWSAVPGRDNEGVYVRGAAVLHMLREHLGTEVYDAGIRLYLDRNADRLVESDDLRRALEDVSGTHLGWFFDQWVHGTGIPKVSTGWSWSEGELVVTLNQEPGEGPAFAAPVVIEIGSEQGAERKTVWLGEGETRLVMPLEAAPRWVAVDANGGLLADWTHQQEPASWAAQATESPSPYARIIALEQLGEAPADPVAITALATVLVEAELDPMVRRVAATSLGSLSSSAGTDALWSVRDVEDSYLREAVIRALGESILDEREKGELARIARSDRSPEVRAAAVEALAKSDSDQGAALARRVLGGADRSWMMPVHRSAAGVLGEHGERSDVGLLTRKLDAGLPRYLRYTAGLSIASIMDRLDADEADRVRPRVEPALIDALYDDDQRVRQMAISLLGRVGDEAGEDALEAFAAANEVPGLSQSALDAASAIRTRGPDAPEPMDTGDVERLEQALDELRERLERLEDWR